MRPDEFLLRQWLLPSIVDDMIFSGLKEELLRLAWYEIESFNHVIGECNKSIQRITITMPPIARKVEDYIKACQTGSYESMIIS